MNRLIPHGTLTGYTTDLCRCTACRAAMTAYVRLRRAQRRTDVALRGLPETVAHGLSAYQNWSCRCEVCTQAERERWRRRAAGATS